MVLRHPAIVLLLALAAICVAMPPAVASEDAGMAVPPLEAMEKALESVRNAPAEDLQGQRLKELYTSAVQNLRAAADNRLELARFERLQADAPQRSARFTAELQDLQRTARRLSISRDMSVERLERRLCVLQGLHAPGADGDSGARGGKPQSDGPADASTAARHHHLAS